MKLGVNEMGSSAGYEPQAAILSSSQAVMTSMPCSTQSEVQLSDITPEENTLSTLHTFDQGNQQTSLTTLHSQVPLHHPQHAPPSHTQAHHQHELEPSFSHHQNSTTSITHYTHSHVHHPTTGQNLLSHQSLTTALVPLQPKDQQQHQHQHLTQAEVQSIYLVPDIQTAVQDKTSSTS